MTCREFWDGMPELAEETECFDHLLDCAACARLLEQQRGLAAGLKTLGRGGSSREAPQRVEARLIEAFRVQTGAPAARRGWRWWTWAPAAAALIVVAILASRAPNATSALPQISGTLTSDGESEFMPLPYEVRDAEVSGPSEDDDLVRVEVPRSALLALGVPVPVDGGSERVEAVLALGADGRLEGVRIVQ